MLAALVENWRLLLHRNSCRNLHMVMVVMASRSVQGAFWICDFSWLLRVHLYVLQPLFVLVLIRMRI